MYREVCESCLPVCRVSHSLLTNATLTALVALALVVTGTTVVSVFIDISTLFGGQSSCTSDQMLLEVAASHTFTHKAVFDSCSVRWGTFIATASTMVSIGLEIDALTSAKDRASRTAAARKTNLPRSTSLSTGSTMLEVFLEIRALPTAICEPHFTAISI